MAPVPAAGTMHAWAPWRWTIGPLGERPPPRGEGGGTGARGTEGTSSPGRLPRQYWLALSCFSLVLLSLIALGLRVSAGAGAGGVKKASSIYPRSSPGDPGSPEVAAKPFLNEWGRAHEGESERQLSPDEEEPRQGNERVEDEAGSTLYYADWDTLTCDNEPANLPNRFLDGTTVFHSIEDCCEKLFFWMDDCISSSQQGDSTHATKLADVAIVHGNLPLKLTSDDDSSPDLVTALDEFNSYLGRAQESLKAAASTRQVIRVVMGNRAADADSIISSLVLAFHRAKTQSNVVPLINIPRSEFYLRAETKYLMDRLGLDVSSVVFADEVDLEDLFVKNQLELVLTDHNTLSVEQQYMGPAVIEIIDHHNDDGYYPDAKRDIAFDPSAAGGGRFLAASCCTLIAERIPDVSPAEATLLLAAISLDSKNFKPRKATPRDLAVRDRIAPLSLIPNPELYDGLLRAKYDPQRLVSLSVGEWIRYDAKVYQLPGTGAHIGISSVRITMKSLLEKESSEVLHGTFKTFCGVKNIRHLIIMVHTKGRKRSVLHYSPEKEDFELMKSVLESIEVLQLKEVEGGELVKVYAQGNKNISRKGMVPLLEKAYLGKFQTPDS